MVSPNPSVILAISTIVVIIVFLTLQSKKPMDKLEQAPLGIGKLIRKARKNRKPSIVGSSVRKPRAQLNTTPRSALGSKNKNTRRKEPKLNCDNVSLDSPDFAKCASLGAARTTLPGKPTKTAHNINTAFVKDSFTPVGNPFSKDLESEFVADSFVGAALINSGKPISSDAAKAFPFATKSSGRDLGSGMSKTPFRSTLTLGAAVSPSMGKLGMSQDEVEQSARRLEETNVVQQTTGGQLNLLRN